MRVLDAYLHAHAHRQGEDGADGKEDEEQGEEGADGEPEEGESDAAADEDKESEVS